jgi:hypothetical protein
MPPTCAAMCSSTHVTHVPSDVLIYSCRPPISIVLKAGIHFLNDTMELGPSDSGLTITGPPTSEGQAWVSGGIPLKTTWTKWTSPVNASWNIWVRAVVCVCVCVCVCVSCVC